MVFSGTGFVANGLHVCGLSWSPVYLIDAERPILFEAGFTCAWKINEQMIRSALMGRQPELLFLTHVHWDHCGGTAYLKRAFPGLKVAASEEGSCNNEETERPGIDERPECQGNPKGALHRRCRYFSREQ